MTNLEREMKLKMLDEEELEFQSPIEEDDFDFEILDDETFIIETIAETTQKSPKKESRAQSSTKNKKTVNQAAGDASATRQTKDKPKKETKKSNTIGKTPEKEPEQTTYQQGTEPPVIKIIPVAEPTEAPKTDSFEQTAKTMQSTTEEFEYEEAAPNTEETLEGEVEEKAQTIEFTDEARQSHREFAETSSNASPVKEPDFGRWNWINTAKQIGSLAAVLAVFIICFQSYGYYIEKNASPITNKEVVTAAENAKETVVKKTSETLEPYQEQAEEKKTETQTAATSTVTKTSQESNLVKIDKIIAKKHEQNEQSAGASAEETQTRFATLKDLTKYINDNTLLLYDILENTEEKYVAGTITIEEYSRIYTEAKEKLQELSTLLTTNENVYIAEQQSSDYNVLIENINTLNDTY